MIFPFGEIWDRLHSALRHNTTTDFSFRQKPFATTRQKDQESISLSHEMNSSASLRRPAILLGLTLLLVGCSKPEEPALLVAAVPTVAQIAANFQGYRQITREPAKVSTQATMMCIRPHPDPRRFRGTQGPHSESTILIFMNETAADTFTRGGRKYPIGSVIVKQKLPSPLIDRSSRVGVMQANLGVGGMVKRPAGYDPEHGDWEYFYFDDPADVTSGRMANCVECHHSVRRTDYVFGTWMKH